MYFITIYFCLENAIAGIQKHGIVCIANPFTQLVLINPQVIDNTNYTTIFYCQLNIGRLRIVEILCHQSKNQSFEVTY